MKNMFYFYLKPNKLLGQPSTYMDDLQLSDILRFFFLRQNQGEQLLKHSFTKFRTVFVYLLADGAGSSVADPKVDLGTPCYIYIGWEFFNL